jgi:putative ABC transport system substrate-binding protein
MTSRRQFLVAGALGALSVRHAGAQARPPRVGMLTPFGKAVLPAMVLQRLSELGYRDGAGMVLELRSADGVEQRYPKLARELIETKCDLVFAFGDFAAGAFRDARAPVPVVFIAPDTDPLEKGYVDSLRRPGRNMTGVYAAAAPLALKRLEIAQEVLPRASRFLVLADTHSQDQLAALKSAAEARRVRLTVVEYKQRPSEDDLAAAFEAGRRAGVEALLGLNSPHFVTNRTKLAALIANDKLPAFVPATWGESGILVTYYANILKFTRRAAELGVQILKGAKPADIPVEQLDEFELVVNLKTAKTLGVKIPYSVLARATRVIE